MENYNQSNKITSSNNNDSSRITPNFSTKILYYLISAAFYLINIILLLYIENKILSILTTITFTKVISIPLLILLHLIFLRYLIIQLAFPGQNYVLSRSILYNHGINKADPIYKSFTAFYDAFSVLNNRNKILSLNFKNLEDIKKQIEIIENIINHEIEILNKMNNKFHYLTNDQQVYYNNLMSFNDALKEGNFSKIVSNTINLIKKDNCISIKRCSEESKNEIMSEFSKKSLSFQKLLIRCYTIMNQLKDYLGNKNLSLNVRNIRNFFRNKLFSSVEQLHCELDYYFKFEEKFFITQDKNKIEYIIIKNNSNKDTKKLMIVCGPNGVPYQIYSRNAIVKYYLDLNMDILCWNYRGYGFSEGSASYDKVRSDILELFDEVKKTGRYEHFAIYGISIGGIPCCHLGRYRKEIELMICDRNFGKLDNIVQNYNYGKFLYILYKLLCFQTTDNVDNYLNTNCYKILLNDPKDEIIYETCSLKTLISAELCKKYFECHNININANTNFMITSNENLYGVNNELESLKSINNANNKNTQNNKLNSINNIIVTNYNINKNSKNLDKITALDKIFDSIEEKNKFISGLLNISNIIRENKEKEENSQYSNLKEEERQNMSDINNILETNLTDIFDSLKSAGDTLSTLFNIRWDYSKSIFIDNFFNNLFIWGTKNINNDEHSTGNIELTFNKFMQSFEKFLNSTDIKPYKGLQVMKDIEVLYEYFIIIKNNIKFVGLQINNSFVKLADDIDNNYEQSLMELNRGYFIHLNCGHNGILFHNEMDLFKKYLMNSEFFAENKNNEVSQNILIEDIFENEKSKSQEDNDELNVNSVDSDKNINEII